MSLMRAFLEVIDGPGKGRRIALRDGQTFFVGRTRDGTDIDFPDNKTMSSVHFSARLANSHCEITDQKSANGTWWQDRRINEALLHAGDEIRAGRAIFRFVVHGEEMPLMPDTPVEQFNPYNGNITHPEMPVPVLPPPPPPAINPLLKTGLEISLAGGLAGVELSEQFETGLVEEMPVPQFVELLASRELFLDALKVVANSLTKRTAVDWACRCVRAGSGDQLSPGDEAAVAAAEAWVRNPEENERRQAQATAEALEHKTPASWAATAAFWSSGSLGPPTAPVVPPAPHLTAHAAAGAAMLTAVARNPDKAPEKYRLFLQLATELMSPQPRA